MIITGSLRRFVPVWENQKYAAPCEAELPDGDPGAAPLAAHPRGPGGRGRRPRAGLHPLSGRGLRLPLPEPVHAVLHARQIGGHGAGGHDPDRPGQHPRQAPRAAAPERPAHRRDRRRPGGALGRLAAAAHAATRRWSTSWPAGWGASSRASFPKAGSRSEVIETELGRIKEVAAARPPAAAARPGRRRPAAGGLRLCRARHRRPEAAHAAHPGHRAGGLRRWTSCEAAKAGTAACGKRVVVIGAGNVGCDAATEAHRLGAEDILLLDVQQPASFGKERQAAEAAGARFRWPVVTREITAAGVTLADGEEIPPTRSSSPSATCRTSPSCPRGSRSSAASSRWTRITAPATRKVFAIGDVVRPGLLTDAIGAGRARGPAHLRRVRRPDAGALPAPDDRKAPGDARVLRPAHHRAFADVAPVRLPVPVLRRLPGLRGLCRRSARRGPSAASDLGGNDYEYAVDENLCIGCGFCAGACPCGVWNLEENQPAGVKRAAYVQRPVCRPLIHSDACLMRLNHHVENCALT